MKKFLLQVLPILAGMTIPLWTQSRAAETKLPSELHLRTKDGIDVFADYYPAPATTRSVVLLFHQANSNRGEYRPIAPRLNQDGYDALAIDQRSGGDMWGVQNKTVVGVGGSKPYMEALPDLEAALDWAAGGGKYDKVYLWGSSYSASLVFVLAQKHQNSVSGILSFSPGEYLGERKNEVQSAAKSVGIPSLVLAPDEDRPQARTIFDALASGSKWFVVPPNAVHGSSMLRPDKNKEYLEVWPMVEIFLKDPKAKH